MKMSHWPLTHFAMAILMTCLLSCGKKANEEKKPQIKPVIEPQTTELDTLLERQELICDQGKCPKYLVKIAIKTKDQTLKFCTGILTDPITVATTTSCLPESLRVEDLSCDKDIHFFFEDGAKPIRAKCRKVLKVSEIETKDPVLWRSDVSFLELESKLDRRALRPENIWRGGMGNLAKFIVWSIDSENDFVGHIKKNECEAIHNTYFNPFSNDESSPNVTIAGCPYVKGNSGSPVLDYRGRLRGMISRPIDSGVVSELMRRGILENTLKPISFAANFACAPTIYDTDVLNFDECTKKLEESIYLQMQSQMISIDELFKAPLLRLEAALNEANRYIKVRLLQITETYDTRRIKIVPRCFKNVSRWIGEFTSRDAFNFYMEIPEKTLKRSMDDYGRLKVVENDRAKFNYTFQFYPKILKSSGKATIFVLKPQSPWENFPGMNENCSLL